MNFKLQLIILFSCLACAISGCTPKEGDATRDSLISANLIQIRDSEYNEVRIRFTNHDQLNGIRLLKPLDGSLCNWIMPHYDFSVDHDGEAIAISSRCGVFGHPWMGTTWPGDYIIDLASGESHEEVVNLPHDISEPGEYLVSFSYTFEIDDGDTTPGGPYPENLWQGTVAAKSVKMNLK